MKEFLKDFGKFIAKGNIINLAIGLIIGAAFNAIVQSLVNDIIMPLFSAIVKSDIATLKVVLVPEVLDEAGEVVKKAVTLNYGNFIQVIVNFLVISLSIFVAIRITLKIRSKMAKVEELAKIRLAELKKKEQVEKDDKANL